MFGGFSYNLQDSWNIHKNDTGPLQYNFTYNSSKSSRGTGILISTKLNHVILATFHDTSENILGLNISIENHNFLIASIYGPNTNDPAFFRDIRRFISLDPDANIILGGDWNLNFSINDNPDNIDIFCMLAPPSLFRSRWQADLCDLHQLTDPFCALHLELLDFSLRPKNGRENWSCLDFL